MNIGSFFETRYLKSADINNSASLTIRGVTVEELGEEQQRKLVVWFQEMEKALILNKTNVRAIERALGSDDTENWIGKKILLRVESVTFRGEFVDAIRVVPETVPADRPF